MVLGVPLFKLAPLAFKVVTKPFVDALKKNVRKSPFWKGQIFVPMARSKELKDDPTHLYLVFFIYQIDILILLS